MFNTEGIITVSFFRLVMFLSRVLNKTEAAVLPISKAGWVTVVSGGFKIKAVCRLVKLTTFMSPGTDSFRSLQAR